MVSPRVQPGDLVWQIGQAWICSARLAQIEGQDGNQKDELEGENGDKHFGFPSPKNSIAEQPEFIGEGGYLGKAEGRLNRFLAKC
jgi:hypothetical protein